MKEKLARSLDIALSKIVTDFKGSVKRAHEGMSGTAVWATSLNRRGWEIDCSDLLISAAMDWCTQTLSMSKLHVLKIERFLHCIWVLIVGPSHKLQIAFLIQVMCMAN